MPTVQRYERSQRTDALPGARKSAGETDISTGAGLAQAEGQAAAVKADALGRLGDTVSQVGSGLAHEAMRQAEEARRFQDRLVGTSAINEVDGLASTLVRDPQTGALRVKGPDALQSRERVLKAIDERAGQVAAKLTSDRQRLAFEADLFRVRAHTIATLDNYAAGEMQRWGAQELEGFVGNQIAEAIAVAPSLGDPVQGEAIRSQISAALTGAVERIKEVGPGLGLGPESITAQVAKTQTAVHTGVIDSLLAEGRAGDAREYFEESKDQIGGAAKANVEKAIHSGQTRGAAQKETARILAEGGTIDEQRAKAKDIKDPEVQDDVDRRLQHEHALGKVREQEAIHTLLRDTYAAVDQTHDVDALPDSTLVALGEHLPALRTFAARRAKGEPTNTDPREYYRLRTLASENPEQFLKEDLWKFRAKADDTDFDKILNLRDAIKNGNRAKADDALAGFRNQNEIVKSTLWQYWHVEPKDYTVAQADAHANVMRLIDQWTADEQSAGRKVTNPQVQEKLDNILSHRGTIPGSWMAAIKPWKYDFTAQPGGRFEVETTYGDISLEQRTGLEQLLRQRHQPVTPATVLDLYLRTATQK